MLTQQLTREPAVIRRLQKEEDAVRVQVCDHKLIRMFVINKDQSHQPPHSKHGYPEPLGGSLT